MLYAMRRKNRMFVVTWVVAMILFIIITSKRSGHLAKTWAIYSNGAKYQDINSDLHVQIEEKNVLNSALRFRSRSNVRSAYETKESKPEFIMPEEENKRATTVPAGLNDKHGKKVLDNAGKGTSKTTATPRRKEPLSMFIVEEHHEGESTFNLADLILQKLSVSCRVFFTIESIVWIVDTNDYR